uniref:non-specific serine/threonine protein kinase n=1 Tax=Aegilops tauschii TaxID=37682 RepID=N1QV67_AEGTA
MEAELSEFSVYEFRQILEATSNFSEENKLGEGGFGPVYKGHFPEGIEIAVKRLDSDSDQGFMEFKNEVELIAKLQHRNLVRLMGCCSQGEEKVLVYEYLPNKSLDFFIFDEDRKVLLDWEKRLAIIVGIAEGLLYLHKHSRLRVIHRDLKPSNILLDSTMNAKISDFGLAKIFSSNNNEGNKTRKVVGTYGYMAPEYASHGLFSVKSDVFSFGVLVLEIISGKKNSHECGAFINLIGYAWQLFEEERWIELVDAALIPSGGSSEMMRSINIALLCVQEDAIDRPTMLDVVAMLSSKTMTLNKPKHPAYYSISSVGNKEASAVGCVHHDDAEAKGFNLLFEKKCIISNISGGFALEKPPVGWVKLNIDGSYSQGENTGGAGMETSTDHSPVVKETKNLLHEGQDVKRSLNAAAHLMAQLGRMSRRTATWLGHSLLEGASSIL